jgi:hypothetical protein
MKKIIMTSFAAIAFLIAFTGCSKNDLYDQGAVDERNRQEQEKKDQQKELTVNEKYAAAFEKAFGKVGPNVDWGFSSKSSSTRSFTRAVGTYAQYKGNMQPTGITFPSDCPASNFLTEAQIPTTASAMPDRQVGPGSFVIDENTAQVDVYNGTNCFIYVKGYVDMSNKKFTSEGQKIYLTEGSTLKLSATAAQDLKAKIYIAANAVLETTGHLLIDAGSEVYNHGTIKAESFELTASSIIYNVGKLETTGKTAGTGRVIVNANDRIVNDGTIDCAEVIIRAAAVQNNAEWTVKGTTTIESNNSGWVNNGHWTTYDYAYIAGSWNVINNCFLEVENDFEMNISSVQGAFKIDGGGGVLTKNFYGGRDSSTGAVSGPFVIVMGPKAVFKVTETAQLESSRDDDNGFGIFGPTEGTESEYAVFQAKNIVRDPYLQSINSHGAVAYGGHLYVSAETHFAQGYDSDGTGTYDPRAFIIAKSGFSIDNNIYGAGFKFGKPSINIPQTPCSPGFQGGNPLYRVIAEDLSAAEAGDFDFNDVVFDIVKAEGSKTTLKLICAGGVLPLRVRGAEGTGDAGREVHEVFGDTTPELENHPMYNTGKGPNVDPVIFEVAGTYKTPEQIKNIIIEVYKNGVWMPLNAERGKAACKILVDDTFTPVPERKNIADENGNFTDYVQGKFVDDFWWK